ncbi:MAG: hypothetical protein WBK91_10630 [Alphaproteobacteria bacterium]
MQQLMQYRFYELGAKLYGIFNSRVHSRVTDLFGPLTDAQKSLDALIKGDPIELRIAKPEAVRLLSQISTVFDKYFIDQSSRQIRFPSGEEKVDFQELALINLALEKFESALTAELSRIVVYPATQRGIYSPVDMVENAHRAIPDDMQEFLSDAARRELDAAGRALGFDLGTAAAMHTLRALEIVTTSYYSLFSEAPLNKADRNFSTCLRKLTALAEDDDVKVRPDARLVQFLTQIKESYRNPLITPESIVTTGSAATLFGLVTSIIMQLVEHIAAHKDQSHENGKKTQDTTATVISPIMPENDGKPSNGNAEDNDEDEEDIYDFRVSQAR